MELAGASGYKVLILANYLPDNQASMEAFCQLMAEKLAEHGCAVRIVRPEAFFGKLGKGAKSFNKWLAYLDKYLLFIPTLMREKKWADLVHIGDHSNSVYMPWLLDKPHVITCHDLLAVRAGLGEDTCCPLSPIGWVLQRCILKGLRLAKTVACDSTATLTDAERLLGYIGGRSISLIPLGLNYEFAVQSPAESFDLLQKVPNLNAGEPYILHVGSSQPRKNREGILQVFARIKDKFAGQCVFAGVPLTDSQRQLARQLNVSERVIEVSNVDGEVLKALYNRAFVFLFPSFSEGFGWPILEAQASGCPVIASSVEPCPETAGDGAIISDPNDLSFMAESILKLDDNERQRLVDAGLENLKRFDADKMITKYLELYERAIAGM